MQSKKIYTIPAVLCVINIVLLSFLVKELLAEGGDNYGTVALLTPIFAIASLLYIKAYIQNKNTAIVRILQTLNWLFIIFPIAVFLLKVALMIG